MENTSPLTHIIVHNAHEHNLKNINLCLPKNKLVVITGVSGSGKSTLAFDTIYAEGQRKYIESLSAYARQFLDMMDKPKVDKIEGLSPAISIDQKTTSKNPRSTVGTVTEIYDYLRVLFARVGTPYSPTTGKPIIGLTSSEIIDEVVSKFNKKKIMIMTPLIKGRKGEYKKLFEEYFKKGYERFYVNEKIYQKNEIPELSKNFKHSISVIIDRVIPSEENRDRLANSIEICLNESNGNVEVYDLESEKLISLSNKFMCPVSGFSIDEIEPRLFSFNNPYGACGDCDGLGEVDAFDEDLLIPDKNLSFNEGAINYWSEKAQTKIHPKLKKLFDKNNVKDVIWSKLSKNIQNEVLYGGKNFEGLINIMDNIYDGTSSWWRQWELEKFRNSKTCQSCQGNRLNEKALCIKIDNVNISELTQLSINKTLNWFGNFEKSLSDQKKIIAAPLKKEIFSRLNFLNEVGLNYLSLSRKSSTLSGGESQRIRLASQIGSGLTGVTYVLDEPSIGLHQRDNQKLINTLKNLRDLGNTIIVVEHDEDIIREADYIVDIGKYAGIKGGSIVSEGSFQKILHNKDSLTSGYINGIINRYPETQNQNENKGFIQITNAKGNNLKNVSVKFPLGKFISVTGVSGSGKSTLINETLYGAANNRIYEKIIKTLPYESINGIENIDKVINIDQSPIGRTPRSNPATYVGLFTPIREWFANLPEAKVKGFKPGRFSFNVKGGRCESCEGDGLKKIEMHFLAPVYVKCEVCNGKRYNKETLAVQFKSKNISDILSMTVDDACEFFASNPQVFSKLKTLQNVGLGYISIGQAATTLSGGEAQRIKLSKELSKRQTGKTLYILDEPTTGLHFEDIKKLLEILHKLVSYGNTVIVIEHNLDVINTSDWIIDLGPEGGDQGGKILFEGQTKDLIKLSDNQTGVFLKKYQESLALSTAS
ncbi:excinuclease ABC subunit UvrA [Alphaproteobacteria bacterium]|nr:excinuclease ABC subunit UvrA [Alphaproteobacteria bacterium]